MAMNVSEPVFLSASSSAGAVTFFVLWPAWDIGCLSFLKGSPRSLPAIPGKWGERPVRRETLVPPSDTILHKPRVNRLSWLDVSNPSLRRKLRPLDRPMTKGREGGRHGHTYSWPYGKGNQEAAARGGCPLEVGISGNVTSGCRDPRGRHDLHDRHGRARHRRHVRPGLRRHHRNRGRHRRRRAAPAGELR